jgi:hypothetical protein
MNEFPRTLVGGVSVSRLIVGTNWFLGYSHTSAAKDRFIKDYQTAQRMADVMEVFFRRGVDTVMGPASEKLFEAIKIAEDRTGRGAVRVITPSFNVLPGGEPQAEPRRVLDYCRDNRAALCFPHQSVTDRVLDRLHRVIRGMDEYSAMIRQRGMIPGLSTHAPEAVVIADESGSDVESYIQPYNSAGFLMQLEADWVMRIIRDAKKPVMTIKPLAAGAILPPVGLAFVWNTIRDQDMVTIGTTTPDEARECVDLSLTLLDRRLPDHELQKTRSKKSVESSSRRSPA